VIATYLHGPVLPKNAWLTDHLLALALDHAHGGALAPLAHPREDAAQREAVLVAERDARHGGRRGRAARRLRPGEAR
jgi:CobQ-like glutamine amidotransferase family enzyme